MTSSETPLHYKCVKNKLKHIVIDGEAEGIVKETVLTVHRIAIHAMQFIKLFLLVHYERHGSTPTVTKLLVMNCMAVVRESKEHKNTKNKADMAVLRSVFESKYKPAMHESDHAGMIAKNLTQVLDYCATSIVAEYETNIKQHYAEYVERFVNVMFDKNEVAKDMDSAEKAQLYSNLRRYKRAVLERDEASLPPLLSPHYSKIKGPETQRRNINYDIQCQPQAYLPSMIYMMKFVEGKGCRMANVFPVRTALIPKYITLDTTTLVQLLMKKKHYTLDPRRYVEYLRAKNRINAILLPFYAQETFRKMRWHAYINMSRSESVMINRFKEKFGPPQDVVIAMGDWEQKHQARFKQPTKGVGMRKLFKKHGYADLFLVNEFRTSKKCHACGDGDGDCEKFMHAPRPKPCGDRHTCGCTSRNVKRARFCAKKHEPALVHGLVRCTTCTRIWNRDVNGSLNIFSIATLALHNQPRPRHLCRERKRKDSDGDNAPARKKPKTITAGPMTAEPPMSGLLAGQDQK
jgi:hypothetical protein